MGLNQSPFVEIGQTSATTMPQFKKLFDLPQIITLILVIVTAGVAQAIDNQNAEQFGDIFVHPRDRHYLPGSAPSRAELFDSGIDYNDERGDVSRWEYRKDNRIITREVWTEENGEPKGRLGIGRKF